MAVLPHVSGECIIKTGTGASNALEILGVSERGVTIEGTTFDDPIIVDTFGPHVPFDEQQFLQSAVIRMRLPLFDWAVVGHVRGRAGGTDGVLGACGQLWGAGGLYFRLLMLSPIDATPVNFLHCRLLGPHDFKIGTEATRLNFTFLATPYTGVTGTTAGTVLWNQVTA